MKINFKIPLFILALLQTVIAVAQDTATTTPPAAASKFSIAFDTNTVLAITVALLLFVIILLAFMLKSSIDLYRDDHLQARRNARSAAGKSTLVLIFLLISVTSIFAQAEAGAAATDAAASVPPVSAYQFNSKMISTILIVAIAIEIFAIFYLIKWIKFFTGIQAFEDQKRIAAGEDPSLVKKGGFKAWWHKINKFRSMKEEGDLETGHEYDGIKELDNATPPWFTWSFLATIVIAIVYVWYYNSSSAMTQQEEYEHTVKIAEEQIKAYMATQANAIDENTVEMLDEAGIAAGQKIFTTNCVACHGAQGGGGIGPNLTDSYSIHGANIKDVFHTIKYGVIDKGMQSWQNQLSPSEIAEVSSYIVSIQGTNVSGGKEPQGEPFKSTEAQSPVTSPDSSGVPQPLADSGKVVAKLVL